MSEKVNTTKTLAKAKELSDKELQAQIDKMGEKFKSEKMVPFSIPVSLQKFIGTELYLGINGVKLVLPVDGKKRNIPESFAQHGQDYINNLTT